MTEVVRDRTGGAWTVLTWGSQARAEVMATSLLLRTDGTAWGGFALLEAALFLPLVVTSS
jgi:hypothetical protein